MAKKPGFLPHFFTMLSGATLAQVIPLLLLPVITRIYTPNEIGVFAAFLSIFVILASFMTARYEYAILLPKRNVDAEQLFYLGMGSALATTLLTAILLLLWAPELARLAGSPAYASWLYLIPVSMFFYSIFLMGSYYLTRYKDFGGIAVSKVVQATSMSSTQVGLGWMGAGSMGMVVGKVLGDMFHSLVILWRLRTLQQAFRAGVSFRHMRVLALKYRNFPLYNTPHAFFNTTSNNVSVLVYNRYFSEAATGYYALAVRFTFGPVHLITRALAQVFSKEITDIFHREEAIYPFFRKTVYSMALYGVVPFFLLWMAAPELFAWLLGTEYRATGVLVRMILPWVFVVYLTSPVTFIPILLQRQRKAMLIDFFYMVLRFAGLYAGVRAQSMEMAVVIYSVLGVVVQTYLLLWIRKLTIEADNVGMGKNLPQ